MLPELTDHVTHVQTNRRDYSSKRRAKDPQLNVEELGRALQSLS
jgi:hypothetical protein